MIAMSLFPDQTLNTRNESVPGPDRNGLYAYVLYVYDVLYAYVLYVYDGLYAYVLYVYDGLYAYVLYVYDEHYTIYKMNHTISPQYLIDLLPAHEQTRYNLRTTFHP